jgi:hypothetical protein
VHAVAPIRSNAWTEERQCTQVRAVAIRLAAAAALLFALGCGEYGGGGTASSDNSAPPPDSGLPPGGTPGPGTGDPAAAMAAFETTVYPLLTQYCTDCHAGAGPGSPHIAQPDLATAYRAVVDNQKVNFSTPASSRLVRRLVADFHHCWSNCMSDGMAMEAAIAAWALALQDSGGGGPTQSTDALESRAMTLAQGVEDAGEQRYSDGLIAFWDFKEGTGSIAHDTSGVAPAIDLELVNGPTWMSSYGIAFETGMARATAATSRKLYDRLAEPNTGTQQYSVEAWVIPGNTDQEGPARIINYSQGTGSRNFGLGQVLYTYDFRNRSVNADVGANGTPSLRTYDADEDLQATLQHVVVTYDQFRGRRIFVNGRFTDDVDEVAPSRLWNWDPNFRFVLGNETSGDRQWVGRIQLVAIYDRALSDAQIQQNFAAGVGRRLILRFDVGAWVGAGSFLEFVVSEFDDYSYLFCRPTFATANPSGFRVANMRVVVNGQIPVSGQAFVNVDTFVTSSRQELSPQCSIVPKDRGSAADVFSIAFEYLGAFEDVVVADPPPVIPPPVFAASLPVEGNRDFARINDSMAAITGVSPTTAVVQETFNELAQQLPSGFDLRAFASAQQVGISKLALEYCDRLVETPALRTAFFGTSFDFAAPATVAFSDSARRAMVIGPLVDRMLGTNLGSVPTRAEVEPVLNQLFDELTAGCTDATCPAERTRNIVKGACAAVLGSAAVTIH